MALADFHDLPRLTALPLIRRAFADWRRRRSFRRLNDLDDQMLDDIGVTREEVQSASRLPLSVNASVVLHRMALERRRAER